MRFCQSKKASYWLPPRSTLFGILGAALRSSTSEGLLAFAMILAFSPPRRKEAPSFSQRSNIWRPSSSNTPFCRSMESMMFLDMSMKRSISPTFLPTSSAMASSAMSYMYFLSELPLRISIAERMALWLALMALYSCSLTLT
ncbi:MAG: CRISPR-associated protein Cas5 [Saprospiraceae bacterium]